MARHWRAIDLFRVQAMNVIPAISRPRPAAAPAALDAGAIAAMRSARDRDLRLVVLVLAAALVTGLSVLVHSLS
jgi:hypothetical protein